MFYVAPTLQIEDITSVRYTSMSGSYKTLAHVDIDIIGVYVHVLCSVFELVLHRLWFCSVISVIFHASSSKPKKPIHACQVGASKQCTDKTRMLMWSMKKKIHLVIGVLELVGCCCIACYLAWHLHVQIKQECWCGRSLGEWDLATHVFLTKISRKPQQVSSYRPCWFSSFVSARTLWASGDTHMWMLAMCFY
jgi:hypothetical protein